TLQTELDTHTGGIYGTISIFEDQQGNVQPYFVLKGKALETSFDHLVELLKEVMTVTDFTDTTEISKITQRLISGFEGAINNRSHILAANRALSQIRPATKLGELTSGIDQFNHLKAIREEVKEESTDLSLQLTHLLRRLLNKNRLNILYTGEQSRVTAVKETLRDAFVGLTDEPLGEVVDYQPGVKQNEAYITAQDVNYVGVGADAKKFLDFTGASNVLATAIRYDYLWNHIRVK